MNSIQARVWKMFKILNAINSSIYKRQAGISELLLKKKHRNKALIMEDTTLEMTFWIRAWHFLQPAQITWPCLYTIPMPSAKSFSSVVVIQNIPSICQHMLDHVSWSESMATAFMLVLLPGTANSNAIGFRLKKGLLS